MKEEVRGGGGGGGGGQRGQSGGGGRIHSISAGSARLMAGHHQLSVGNHRVGIRAVATPTPAHSGGRFFSFLSFFLFASEIRIPRRRVALIFFFF